MYMLKQIGEEWKTREEGGSFSATHLSPSQLNLNIDQWHYNYNVLTAAERKKLPANLKMICGGLVGQALQDMITNKLTVSEVIKGKK